MKIVLIGIQGSGKSTQGNLLSHTLGIPYLSTGHIFREMAKEHTKLGRYIKETMNAGYLIPDGKTMRIVTEYLTRPEYQKGYIMDGFPRTVKQAEGFGQRLDHVIYLKVADEAALRRLNYRNGDNGLSREDDTERAIAKRIELFHKFTEPVLDYYRQKGILLELDGEMQIEQIHQEIMLKISSK